MVLSTSPPPTEEEVSNTVRIRSNFLNKLGIEEEKQQEPKQREPARGSLLGKVQVTSEPLKYEEAQDQDEEEQEQEDISKHPLLRLFQPSSTDSEASESEPDKTEQEDEAPKTRDRRLAFSEDVEVVPIPERSEYSKRVQGRLWANADEIQENAQRNAMEFMAEGWDWRQVTEDENMYRCAITGELIHPVHCNEEAHETMHQ